MGVKEGQPIRLKIPQGEVIFSQTPTGAETSLFLPKKPVYLGGQVNRVSGEPIWETEARESRERFENEEKR